MNSNIKDEWKQYDVIHCPDTDCDGMLLQNPYKHEMKCSKCEKYWIEITKFIEVDMEE